MGYVNWKRGRERLNDMALLSRLVDDLRAQRPDHVAVTGDLVNIGMPDEFRRAAAWMETLGDPADVSFVPGNHDAYVRAAMPMLAATFEPWTTGDSGASTFPYLRVRGEVAIIGLSSGRADRPADGDGKARPPPARGLGRAARRDRRAQDSPGSCSSTTRRSSKGAPPLRGLTDAAAFERIVRDHGAEAILHGHTHKQLVRSLPSRAAKTVGGRVPVLGAPAAAAATHDPRYRAAYHLVRLDRDGERWRVSARARGLALDSEAIGEREALAV